MKLIVRNYRSLAFLVRLNLDSALAWGVTIVGLYTAILLLGL